MTLGKFRGSVIKYDVERSFGFIKVEEEFDDGHFLRDTKKLQTLHGDAFVYFKDIEPESDGFKKLIQGQVVEFDLQKGDRGLVAKEVYIKGEKYDSNGSIQYYTDDAGEATGNV